jgi:hypothetical protein
MKLTQLLLGKTLVTGNKSIDSKTSLKINNKTPRINVQEKNNSRKRIDGQTQCN